MNFILSYKGSPLVRLLPKKLIKIMKLTAILFFVSTLSVCAKIRAQKVTISGNDMSLTQVLKTINKQTGYQFVYPDNLLDNAKVKSVNFKEAPLAVVLKQCLKSANLDFQIEYNTIIISSKMKTVSEKSTAIKQSTIAALAAIHGKITDSTGKPIGGVSVEVLGAKKGVIANSNGEFSINAKPGDVLQFSFIGYFTKTVVVKDQTELNVIMAMQSNALNDVVTIGYGTEKKSDLTGSVGVAPIGDMQKAPVLSFDQALQGRMAGVVVSSVDGQPGSAINIVIRGNNSITQNNSPLYVVDGFPIEDPNNNAINPDDIESISVLKDASATAIYGARGANGVIIITTKSGKIGAPVVNFGAYYGKQSVSHTVPLMDPYNYVKYQLEASPGDATVSNSAAYYYLRDGLTLNNYQDTANVNWESLMFRSAPMQNYDVSVTGGSAQTKYAVSGSVLDQDGVIINSGYKRYQGRIVLNQKLGKKFNASVNVNYTHLEQSGVSPSSFLSSSSATSTLMYSVWGFKPFGPTNQPFDPNVSANNDYRFNPVLNQQNIVRQNNTNNLAANAFVTYDITKNLQLKVSGGVNTLIRQAVAFNDTLTSSGNPNATFNKGVNGSVNYITTNNWLNENTLTYDKRFNTNNRLNVVVGVTEQGQHTSTYGLSGTQLPTQATNVSWLSSGTMTPTINSDASLTTLASFLGRVNYTFHSDYLLTASYRADGSSKFAPQNHWSYFPSGAFAWKFGNMPFIRNSKAISDGKLRISYGLTGNNRVGPFDYLSQYGVSTIQQGYTFGNAEQAGLIVSALGNRDLKWETTGQWDLGLDMGFLKNRINLTADVYRKVTKNLLLNANIPTSYGYSNILKNVGSVQNQGLEISINTVNIQNPNFSWNSSFNISFNQSKVLALADGQNSMLLGTPYDNTVAKIPSFLVEVGKPLGLMYGPIFDGIYQYSDFDVSPSGAYSLKGNIPTNGNVRSSIQPGDIKYKDLNGDGTVDINDATVIGRGLPKNTGGFNNDFTYKGFDLNIFFQWSYGNNIMNVNRLVFEGNQLGKTNLNQYASYENRWTPTNQSNTLFRASLNNTSAGPLGNSYSSRVVEDGSYLRLKTVSLGYNLPQHLMKRWGIKNLNFYVSAQNLYTWTKYSGNDPEVSVFNSPLTAGVDYSAYPRARTITIGIKASL